MLLLRSLVFYFILLSAAVFFGFLGIFLIPLPYRIRSQFFLCFNRVVLAGLRIVCKVDYEVSGLENLPSNQPAVILAKHQSTWETFFLQLFFHPTSTILKRELLRIPFFGWGLALLRPIPIDRSNPREALKKVKSLGLKRLEEGNNVLVFPEGTRTPVGEVGNYARSGADIAINGNTHIIPVAHNAGVYWPMDTIIKRPGTIKISIGEPISTEGKNSKQLIQEAKAWIESEVESMTR
ncbi:MAG: 1-acyl-sn-glycerol-3-phosphate acyltransferase [Cellvibrionaceae bacterium]|mgnify:CR=1 FL=1|nr:1-acyl-sn-glycerol-3-phosphate acyltransferase [Cellvibrionaceae bacterium]|tara:strand:- start:22125 stop:22835 length:711 start_codon:yes stop_codon:yes gene_type:complete